MHFYYFGESEKLLLGAYHPPQSHRVKDTGVILCHPTAQEYIRAYRAMRQLAMHLSKAGFHAMRFDYYGTGDSYGDDTEASLREWKANIHAAIDEFKDTSGVKKVCLIGLRLGAALAASVDRADVADVVLWDPVVNGHHYLEGQKTLHRSMLADRSLFPVRRAQAPAAEEILGFVFPVTLRDEICQINLLQGRPCGARRKFLIVSEQRDDYTHLRDALNASGSQVFYRIVNGPGEWDKVEKVEIELTPAEILQTITNEMVKELR